MRAVEQEHTAEDTALGEHSKVCVRTKQHVVNVVRSSSLAWQANAKQSNDSLI